MGVWLGEEGWRSVGGLLPGRASRLFKGVQIRPLPMAEAGG